MNHPLTQYVSNEEFEDFEQYTLKAPRSLIDSFERTYSEMFHEKR